MGGQGSLPWTKHFSSPALDSAWGVAANLNGDTTIQFTFTQPIDFGGGPISPTGRSVGLARLDKTGKHIWSKAFPHTTDADPKAVLEDGQGNLILLGSMEGSFGGQDFGGPSFQQACDTNIYLAKLDGDGNHVWSKLYYSCAASSAIGRMAPDHAVILLGQTNGTVDFGSGPITSKGSGDVILAKIDGNGTGVWAKSFGDAKNQMSSALAVDQLGNVMVAGINQGTINLGGGAITAVATIGDGWIAKFDITGAHLWSRGLPSSLPNQNGIAPSALAADSQGNMILAGNFSDEIDFGAGVVKASGLNDLFIAKYDPTGSLIWVKQFGTGAAPAAGNALDVAANDEIVFNGAIYNSADLGCGTVLGSSGGDTVLARFSPAGLCLWSQAITTNSPNLITGTANVAMSVDALQNAVVYGIFGGALSFGAAFGGAVYTETDPGNQHADLFLGKFKL
jgi:hypothetical protein